MIKIEVETALGDAQLQQNLTRTLGKARHSRDEAVREIPNWEELRQYARDVKLHTLSRLGDYLEQLERAVVAQGGQVVWAETGEEAVRFILDLARSRGVRSAVKGKSMATEEIHLNAALSQAGVEPVETDLGEYIVQLTGETPFHLVAPALHLSRQQIGRLFVEKLGMEPTEDAEQITLRARRLLRQQFLAAGMGITGVNFAVAETGTLVVVENEGNGRLTASLPEIYVAVMGIEKVIPRLQDLAVFLTLLPRSATGQKMTSYVNLLNGPRRPGELDGPGEFYLVLLDNGRSRVLEDPYLRQTLACIRCGACLNACPVYERIGGHAYGSTYQGPIGAILTPQLLSAREAPQHPFASSLCGACYEVCPVKIEIPHILLKLREKVQAEKASGWEEKSERLGIRLWAWVMKSPRRYARAGRWGRVLARLFQRRGRPLLPFPPFNRWSRHRHLPTLPRRAFRDLYRAPKGR